MQLVYGLLKVNLAFLFCGSFSSFSFRSSFFSSLGSSCSSEFCLLLGYGFSLSGVLGSFFLKASLGSAALSISHTNLDGVDFRILSLFPSIETLLSFFSRESTLLYAALQVLH